MGAEALGLIVIRVCSNQCIKLEHEKRIQRKSESVIMR